MEKFLIIDDKKAVRETYETLISRYYDNPLIDHATNGLEGFEKASTRDYSLILLDIEMAGMNGIEFYKKVKKELSPLENKIIFISGKISQSKLSYLQEEGCHFLYKPFLAKDFLYIIKTLLEPAK